MLDGVFVTVKWMTELVDPTNSPSPSQLALTLHEPAASGVYVSENEPSGAVVTVLSTSASPAFLEVRCTIAPEIAGDMEPDTVTDSPLFIVVANNEMYNKVGSGAVVKRSIKG